MTGFLDGIAARKEPVALSVLLALGALAGIGAGTASGAASTGAVSCRIDVTERSGGTILEGVVSAKSALKGSYSLVVTKSGDGGSSDINQSGDFNAAPGTETSLGTVSLGGNGGNYKARLTVTWDGRSTDCRESVSGAL